MITLGIETSCDETALSLLETREIDGVFEYRVISSLIHSQAELHSAYGGVFPTLAKREHEKNLVPLLKKILDIQTQGSKSEINAVISNEEFSQKIEQFKSEYTDQNIDLFNAVAGSDFLRNIPKIDTIAVTQGPGLEPALWTGIVFAKMLSELWKLPVVPVNHMEGHVYGSLLDDEAIQGNWHKLKTLSMPAIALLISGGHTEIISIECAPNFLFNYTIIGQTRDDAVGEAYDKAARLLSLPYPGGPQISKLTEQAIKQSIKSEIKLPRPMINSKDLDFSFSGLKTAVLYAVRDSEKNNNFNDVFKLGLAREFEDAISETLVAKLSSAIEQTGAQAVIVGGGVSANNRLQHEFKTIADKYGILIHTPSSHVSGDNALMIALVGALNMNKSSSDIVAQGTKRIGN